MDSQDSWTRDYSTTHENLDLKSHVEMGENCKNVKLSLSPKFHFFSPYIIFFSFRYCVLLLRDKLVTVTTRALPIQLKPKELSRRGG